MYYAYVIRKEMKSGDLYIGYTDNLRRRLKEHGVSMKDLIYYEAYQNKEDAIVREKQLKEYKSAWGQLRKRIRNSMQ